MWIANRRTCSAFSVIDLGPTQISLQLAFFPPEGTAKRQFDESDLRTIGHVGESIYGRHVLVAADVLLGKGLRNERGIKIAKAILRDVTPR